jgi:hypothetical protein
MNTVSIMPSVQFAARKKGTGAKKATQKAPPKTQPVAEKKQPIHLHASQVLNEVFSYIAGLEGNAIARNSNQDVSLTIDSSRLADFCTMLDSVSGGAFSLTKGTIPGKYVFNDTERNERVDVVIAKEGGYGKPRQPETNFQTGRISKPRPVR